MTNQQLERFLQIIEEVGLGWYAQFARNNLDLFTQRLQHFLDTYQEYAKHVEEHLCPRQLTLQDIIRTYQNSPWRVHAFVQTLPATNSVDMLVMAWNVINDADIERIRIDYNKQNSFYLEISLAYTSSKSTLTFTSRDISDATVMRHIGIMKANNRPYYSGYYAYGG